MAQYDAMDFTDTNSRPSEVDPIARNQFRTWQATENDRIRNLPSQGTGVSNGDPTPRTTNHTSSASTHSGPTFVTLHDRAIEKPPKYDGRRDNDACEMWLQRVRYWFDCLETIQRVLLDQDQRVAMASGLLTGPAMSWFLVTLPKNKPDDETALWGNFDEWAALLESHFGDIRTQERRRDSFDSLTQRKSVLEFYNLILAKELYLDPRPTEADCLRLFKRGLKPEIRARIEVLPDDALPLDLAGYVQYAMKRELELDKNRQRTIALRPLAPRPSHQSSAILAPRDGDGDTIMTLDALRPGRTATKAETDKFVRDCRERNLCFGCGSPGHRRATCPTNPADPAGKGPRSSRQPFPSSRGRGTYSTRGNSRGKGRRL